MNIFSGKASKRLWKTLNAVSKKKKRKEIAYAAWDALYYLGVKCQELEGVVRDLELKLKRQQSPPGRKF